MGENIRTTPTSVPGRILVAARSRFAQVGYKKTSMEEVAAEAGLVKATIYLHFKGKEEILRELLSDCRRTVVAAVCDARASNSSICERLADMLYAYSGIPMEWFGNARNLSELAAILAGNPKSFGELSGALDEELETLRRFLRAAEEAGEIDTGRAGGLDAVVLTLRDASMGAKFRIDNDPVALKRQLQQIARVVHAAIALQR